MKYLNIHYDYQIDKDKILMNIRNDKKVNREYLDLVVLKTIGKAEIKKVKIDEIEKILKEEK